MFWRCLFILFCTMGRGGAGGTDIICHLRLPFLTCLWRLLGILKRFSEPHNFQGVVLVVEVVVEEIWLGGWKHG